MAVKGTYPTDRVDLAGPDKSGISLKASMVGLKHRYEQMFIDSRFYICYKRDQDVMQQFGGQALKAQQASYDG